MIKKLRNLEDLKYYEVTENNPLFIKLEPFRRKKLYHYTTKKSAKSILSNNCFWITRSDYLDDKKEIKYIYEVLAGVIEYLKGNRDLYNNDIEGQYDIFEAIIKTLEALKEIYKVTTPIMDSHIYLLSLTENKNNRYLLENYAGDHGVVLEFFNETSTKYIGDNKTIFKNDILDKYKIPLFCGKVIYDASEQLTILIEEINEFYTEIITNCIAIDGRINLNEEIVETIKTVIYCKIIHYALFFKHQKFAKEEECRIAFIVGDNCSNEIIKHRQKGNETIPYIEAEFKKESLSKISYR
ncbi:DUF2971 domain-containing protein [Clostridium beijerinckii]|uniref:Uncharacterized protein n=1 Tax=Clostridium beijerinckii TaxID=1520 RepID=A0AAX0BAS0_CLOBE|nr:DUF2971 domain-containing protein [Clostridium beijerinckii]NRT92299.1 hypothetical protein [Clostridium beijerinckii]NYC75558.1 hypothetical protein [Clostridium beijerinckii]